MLNIKRKSVIVLMGCVFFTSFFVAKTGGSSPIKDAVTPDLKQTIENYLKNVADDLNLNVAVILSREKYYEDGTLQKVDSLSFAGKGNNNDFNISKISKRAIENLVTEGENKRVLLSLYQADMSGEESVTNAFDTEEREWPSTAAARIALDDKDFSVGLQNEVVETLDLTDKSGTVEFLEYFDNGNIKRNKTTVFYPKRIVVHTVEKMSAKMEQEAIATVQKAYKIDTDDRAPIIATLFDKKFPKYYWQVLVNATHYWIDENDAQLVLNVGPDEYDILGIKNE